MKFFKFKYWKMLNRKCASPICIVCMCCCVNVAYYSNNQNDEKFKQLLTISHSVCRMEWLWIEWKMVISKWQYTQSDTDDTVLYSWINEENDKENAFCKRHTYIQNKGDKMLLTNERNKKVNWKKKRPNSYYCDKLRIVHFW